MQILVLGGTGFVGRAAAEVAVADGHDVVTFNRGRRGAPPEGVRAVVGDRSRPEDVAALRSEDWDVVIDTAVLSPEVVDANAQALRGHVGHYVLVSTIGVYEDPIGGPDETSPTKRWAPATGGSTGRFYGMDGDYQYLKAGIEQVVLDSFPDAAVVRPGTILGPHEDKGRLPYWLQRIARGGLVLAPGRPERPLQFIDARDLGAFMLQLGATRTGGSFNAISEPGITTTAGLLEACIEATGSEARLVWTDERFLADHGVRPGMPLPIWMPERPPYERSLSVDVSKAMVAGLRCRPATETVHDTWRWLREAAEAPLRDDLDDPAGISEQLEAELLDAWRAASR